MAKRSQGTSAAGKTKRASPPTGESAAPSPPAPAVTPAAPPAAPEKQPYIVLARKYRPQTFEDLIGQATMVTTLRNAFATDRIAQAYMLTGVRGVGKTTTARILARALNYSRPDAADRPAIDMPEPGVHCQAIMESRHPDVVEMDAASNTGVDNVREIVEGARYKPVSARYRVYIIDEVHMLSKGAFNALLKTLEEPPPHVKFIFATTEIRKVPVTVLSRCQRFDLRRVDAAMLVAHFKRIAAAEGAVVEDEALGLIARAAEGSVRDGLSILDQAIAMGSGAATAATIRAMLGLADRGRVFDLIDAVFNGDAKGALERLAALHKDGADPVGLLADLAEVVHLASRAKVAGEAGAGDTLSEDERRRAAALGARLSLPLLARAWQMLIKGLEEAGRAPDPLAAAEMVLIRMAYTADLPTPDEIIRGAAATVPEAGKRAMPSSAPSSEAMPRSQVLVSAGANPTPPPVRSPDAEVQTAEVALASFEDVLALVAAQRDMRLKVMLEEDVSLVRYEPGQIELHLFERAPKELANELREKLNRWTGRKWMVAVSATAGARAVGDLRREAMVRAIDDARRDPVVQRLLAQFPDAEVLEVRTLAPPEDAMGSEDPDRDQDDESAAG